MRCKDVVRAALMIDLGGMLAPPSSSFSSAHNYRV